MDSVSDSGNKDEVLCEHSNMGLRSQRLTWVKPLLSTQSASSRFHYLGPNMAPLPDGINQLPCSRLLRCPSIIVGQCFGTGYMGQWGCLASSPHVLFSEHFIILGCQLLLRCYSKNVNQFPSTSYVGCPEQMLLFVIFGTTECFFLAAMTYDLCIAIYNPLLYSVNMSSRVHGHIQPVLLASSEIKYVFYGIPPVLTILLFF